MIKLLLGKFVLPFVIIVAVFGVPFGWFCYRQIVQLGYQGLHQADFVEFTQFYIEATLITAAVVACVSLVQSLVQRRKEKTD